MSDVSNVSLPDPLPPPSFEPAQQRPRGDGFWGKAGLSFGNLLDVINPLQHIPVVGGVYRAVTGDAISPGARLVGGTLFGGPIGFAASVANLVMEDVTGTDLATSALALVRGTPAGESAPATQVARAAPAPATAAATPPSAPLILSSAAPATAQPAPGPAILAATHAPAPWAAAMAPAQLLPPAATPGNMAMAPSPAQADAIFARLAGQAPAASSAATPDAATLIDAARKDSIFAKLAGESGGALPAAAGPGSAEAWRPTLQPKMSAPIRPKLRSAPVAAYATAPRPLPAAVVAAETQGVAPAGAAGNAPPAAKAAGTGGYSAQELLQLYQRYQASGGKPAQADTNS